MSVDPFALRRSLPLHQRAEHILGNRASRCLHHIRSGRSTDRICAWVDVPPHFVQAIRQINSTDPTFRSHDGAVRYLASLIIWSGGMTSTEHHVMDASGRGRIDLLAELDGQLLVVEYKSGRLGAAGAAAAERQVLRYRNALGAGLPLVVAERGGKPCPSVELLKLRDFAAPLRDRALASISEVRS